MFRCGSASNFIITRRDISRRYENVLKMFGSYICSQNRSRYSPEVDNVVTSGEQGATSGVAFALFVFEDIFGTTRLSNIKSDMV